MRARLSRNRVLRVATRHDYRRDAVAAMMTEEMRHPRPEAMREPRYILIDAPNAKFSR